MKLIRRFAEHALSKSQKDFANAAMANFFEWKRTPRGIESRFHYSQTSRRLYRLRNTNRLTPFANFDPDYLATLRDQRDRISGREYPRLDSGGDIGGLIREIFKGTLLKARAIGDETAIEGGFIATEDRQRIKEIMIWGKFPGSPAERTVARFTQDRATGAFHTEVGLEARLFLISL